MFEQHHRQVYSDYPSRVQVPLQKEHGKRLDIKSTQRLKHEKLTRRMPRNNFMQKQHGEKHDGKPTVEPVPELDGNRVEHKIL